MFQYTVMRKAKPGSDVGPNSHEDMWIVWDVEANSAIEAVEHCADIPGDYVVHESAPIYLEIQPETKLKVQTLGE